MQRAARRSSTTERLPALACRRTPLVTELHHVTSHGHYQPEGRLLATGTTTSMVAG